MSVSGFLYVFLAAALGTVANLLMRAGIDAVGGFAPSTLSQLLLALLRLFADPLFLAGFIAFLLGNIAWFRTIASEPLSIAYPLLVGLGFILITSAAAAFLNEPASLRKVIGLIAILGGIALVSMEAGGR